MNILSEYTGTPEAAAPAVAFLTIIGIAAAIFIVVLIKWFIEESKGQRKPIVFVILLVVVLLGVCIVGNISILSKQEHVLKVTLDETYPATKLLEHYNIRDIEGQIYTIVEK